MRRKRRRKNKIQEVSGRATGKELDLIISSLRQLFMRLTKKL
jgi:hypothetical protein